MENKKKIVSIATLLLFIVSIITLVLFFVTPAFILEASVVSTTKPALDNFSFWMLVAMGVMVAAVLIVRYLTRRLPRF